MYEFGLWCLQQLRVANLVAIVVDVVGGVGGSTVKLMQVETGHFSSVQGKTWYFMKANFAKF